jgi:hypothetical protein
LKEIFIGEKVEGKSGYTNLMKIKNQYYDNIKPHLEKKINALVKSPKEREELFEKLYTFFESYISETGTVFLVKKYENALVIPQKATFEVLDKKFVYVDDSYFSGKTAEKINNYLSLRNSKISTIEVIYDGSKDRKNNVKSFFRYYK